jgi:hypothetical protein
VEQEFGEGHPGDREAGTSGSHVRDLKSPEIQQEIVREVRAVYAAHPTGQGGLEGSRSRRILRRGGEGGEPLIDRSIDIPASWSCRPRLTSGFRDFDLDVSGIAFSRWRRRF